MKSLSKLSCLFLTVLGSAYASVVSGKEMDSVVDKTLSRRGLTKNEYNYVKKDMTNFLDQLFERNYVGGEAGLINSQSTKLVGEARSAANQGNDARSVELLTRALDAMATPKGKALYKTKKIAVFDESRVYCFRGASNFKLKKYPEALADLTLAISICPDYSMPYSLRASVYQALNKNSLAAEDLAKASQYKLIPTALLSDIPVNIKAEQILKKRFRESQASMDSKYYVNGTVSLNNSKFERFLEKAMKQMFAGDYVQAADGYARAIATYDDPKEKGIYKVKEYGQYQLSRCYQGRAYCQLMLKDWERAIDNLSEAIKLFPEIQENYINRGKAYMAINKRREADADFAVAKMMRPHQLPKFMRKDPDLKSAI